MLGYPLHTYLVGDKHNKIIDPEDTFLGGCFALFGQGSATFKLLGAKLLNWASRFPLIICKGNLIEFLNTKCNVTITITITPVLVWQAIDCTLLHGTH
jgi:hypothetical protein